MRYKAHILQSQKAFLAFLLFIPIVSCLSCKKWLDKKPDQALAVPANLNDLQAILDNQKGGTSPGYLELVADNYYVESSSWQSVFIEQRLNYIWDKDARIVFNDYIWTGPYKAISESNLVLDLLPTISVNRENQIKYNSIKGTALFYRAYSFYQLAQLFCRPYSASAATDPGIVLKLTSTVTETYTRSTVQQTYDQIISDFKEAMELLPITTTHKTRPNKSAASAALARTYLSMRDYSNAESWANTSLGLSSELLNFKNLTPTNTLPATFITNPEVLFVGKAGADLLNPSYRPIVDSDLFVSYDNHDLRKTVCFGSYSNGKPYWKGSYYTTDDYHTPFTGIATDEIYLIRAECRARAGKTTDAMADLNALLSNRYDNTFINIDATDSTDALNKILIERRKELLFRGLRWTDLRRLNLHSANITLERRIDNVSYTLPPNDPRWVLLIPDTEINRSGISQNPR